METNTSTDIFSTASKETICSLVDNDCPVKLSERRIIILFAYIAVFVPWGFLALFDMITERWKSIRIIRFQAYFQLWIAFLTIPYTVFYVVIQGVGDDYKEMCAAIVVLCLSAFHFLRTYWGLCQLNIVHAWAKKCLKRLDDHNYKLEDIEQFQSKLRQTRLSKILQTLTEKLFSHRTENRKETLSRILAGGMYVNSSVIDNEFFDSDVPFSISMRSLNVFSQSFRFFQWFRFFPWSRFFPWFPWIPDSKPIPPKDYIVPKYFSESCIRCMIPFLAQFGGKWLKHSQAIQTVLRRKKRVNGVLKSNFFDHAQMLTSPRPCEDGDNEYSKFSKWSNAWLEILLHREASQYWRRDNYDMLPFKKMPTGLREHNSYSRFESKIKRLIDGLHPVFFELSTEELDPIESISSFDLENFVMFLHSKNSDMGSCERSGSLMDHAKGQNGEEERASYLLKLPVKVPNIHFPAKNWELKRLVIEKLGYDKDCLEDSSLYAIDQLSGWPQKHLSEFTCHLENLFSIGHEYHGLDRGRESVRPGYGDYLELLHLYEDRKALLTSKNHCIPRCSVSRWYWTLWRLPLHGSPPIIADEVLLPTASKSSTDRDVKENSWLLPSFLIDIRTAELHGGADSNVQRIKKDTGCIRFLGVIMERVRVCLAKSTFRTSAYIDSLSYSFWNRVIPEPILSLPRKLFHRFPENVRLRSNDFHIRLGRGEGEDEEFLWTFEEQIIWECQRSLLDLVCDGNASYGPGDMQLILLFMLGFPVLTIRVVQSSDNGETEIFVKPVAPGNSLVVSIVVSSSDICFKIETEEIASLVDADLFGRGHPRWKTIETNQRTVELRSIPKIIEFQWEEWIHVFNECMKTLYCDYDSNELEDYKGESSTQNQNQKCSCEYQLNKKAKPIYFGKEPGYYWEWDVWEPQQAFKTFPILFDDDGNARDNTLESRVEEHTPQPIPQGSDDATASHQSKRRGRYYSIELDRQ